MKEPRLYFMQTGEVAKRLHVYDLRNLILPSLFLQIGNRSTRFYHSQYVAGLEAYLHQTGGPTASPDITDTFWKTPGAYQLARDGQRWLLGILVRREQFTPETLAGVLGVTPTTVSNWVDANVFGEGVRSRHGIRIPTNALRDALIWQLPYVPPRPLSADRPSTFLGTQEVTRLLGGTRNQLQRVLEQVPYLYVKKPSTRLFPTSYVNLLADFTHRQDLQRTTTRIARVFRHTALARAALLEAHTQLTEFLKVREDHASTDISELFGVDRRTITGWTNNGTVRAESYSHGGRVITLISSNDLRQAITWVFPC